MGCLRILTEQDIEQLRAAQHGAAAAAIAIVSGNVGLIATGLALAVTSGANLFKVVGNVGEQLTQRTLGGERAYNLNDAKHNAELYDVGNTNRVASVKTRGIGQGSLSSQTIGNYVRDLRAATGYSQRVDDVKKFRAAAETLRKIGQDGSIPLPVELHTATTTEAACAWLHRYAELRVPDDHVPHVRRAIERSVFKSPSTYGLAANASYDERALLGRVLAQRVNPMGMSTDEIEDVLTRVLENN